MMADDDDADDEDEDNDDDDHRVALHELPCDPFTVSESSWGLLAISIIRRTNKILMKIMIKMIML